MRLDKELVVRSLVHSRTLAAKLIGSGAVGVNGRTILKSSYAVGTEDRIEIAESAAVDYVSRAGHKLAGALEVFADIAVAGKRCLDAGASTGGFTDVLLRGGAYSVEAVDVGHGQLVAGLRGDSRVCVHEGVNIRYLDPEQIGGRVQLTVCDLSFISLTLVVEALARVTEPGGDLLLLIKPQFEVGRGHIGRGGVVSDPRARREGVERVCAAVRELGLGIGGVAPSVLPGQNGNIEFFLWCLP